MATNPKKSKKVKIEAEALEFDTYDDDISLMGENIDLDSIDGMIESIDDLPVYLKCLIFGEQGTGKTTLGGTMPPPVLFVDCNERGTLSVRGQGHKRIKVKDYQDLETLYWYLLTKKHPYKSVVVDTTTQGADIVMQQVLRDDDHAGIPQKKHWGISSQMQKTLWLRYRNLPMHVMFLCQLKRLDEDDLTDEEEKTKVPAMSPAVRSMLGAAVDIIGYTYIKEVEKEVKGKLKTTHQYRMRIGPSSDILTKVRVEKTVKYPPILVDPTFDKLFDIITKEE